MPDTEASSAQCSRISPLRGNSAALRSPTLLGVPHLRPREWQHLSSTKTASRAGALWQRLKEF
jgi:hypothetical protein